MTDKCQDPGWMSGSRLNVRIPAERQEPDYVRISAECQDPDWISESLLNVRIPAESGSNVLKRFPRGSNVLKSEKSRFFAKNWEKIDFFLKKIEKEECPLRRSKKTFRHWHHLNYHIRGVQNAMREILSVLLIQVSDLLKPGHNDRCRWKIGPKMGPKNRLWRLLVLAKMPKSSENVWNR